jgi:hypothetical protein
MNNGDHPTLADAWALLPDAVLLPIDTGTKIPLRRAWQKTTFADTQKAGYQRLLANAGTIGALLGPPSNWLADLDCDTEPLLEFMLTNNELPTLRTRGARAGGIWFRNLDYTLERVYPVNVRSGSPLAKGGKLDEKTGLVKIGELRCGHGHSVLCGRHPAGINYQWLEIQAPIELDPRKLTWPEEIQAQLPWNKRQKKRISSAAITGDVAKIYVSSLPQSGPGETADDKTLLEHAKARLPIFPVLWRYFGFPEPACNPTNSPFRTDERPSFSIFEGGQHAFDHSLQKHYDAFDFFQECTNKTPSHAFKPFITLAGLSSRLRSKTKNGEKN